MNALMVASLYLIALVVVISLVALTKVDDLSVKALYIAAILLCFYFVSVVALHPKRTAVTVDTVDADVIMTAESKAIGDELGKRFLEIRRNRTNRERSEHGKAIENFP